MALQVAVCGPAACADPDAEAAAEVGRLLAARGAVVLCGGGDGVMAAVARGASGAGGVVVGIHPGERPDPPAAALTVSVATRLGQARNAVLVASADAVIAVGGSWGTLSEIALARRAGTRVVALGGWRVLDAAGEPVPGIAQAGSPAEAVELALRR